MAQSSSEEKSQPASVKKLNDARKKGQVAQSKDFVSALVMISCVGWLVWRIPHILQRFADLISTTGHRAAGPFMPALRSLGMEAADIALDAVGPLFIAAAGSAVIGALINAQGVIFSTDPLVPRYDRIDPIEGFKRIFAVRSILEASKELAKLVVLGTSLVIVYRSHIQGIVGAARCGLACLPEVFAAIVWPLSACAIASFLAFGLLDRYLQSWLHLREMRMTHSETKRERKDTDGDPYIKRERKRLRQSTQSLSHERGIDHAMLIIGSEFGWIVGLQYRRGVTPVPVVVYREVPAESSEAWRKARMNRIPVVDDIELATMIGRRTPLGSAIPAASLERVASLFVRARLV